MSCVNSFGSKYAPTYPDASRARGAAARVQAWRHGEMEVMQNCIVDLESVSCSFINASERGHETDSRLQSYSH